MSTHKTNATNILLVGNIGELAFPAIAKQTGGDIKLSGTNLVPNIFSLFPTFFKFLLSSNRGGGITGAIPGRIGLQLRPYDVSHSRTFPAIGGAANSWP